MIIMLLIINFLYLLYLFYLLFLFVVVYIVCTSPSIFHGRCLFFKFIFKFRSRVILILNCGMIWKESTFLLVIDTRLLWIILFPCKFMAISHRRILVFIKRHLILSRISTLKIWIELVGANCSLWLTINSMSPQRWSILTSTCWSLW